MAAKAKWLRLNIDFDDSDWLGVLSAEAQLAWVKLLCHGKRDGSAGKVRALSVPVAARKWGVKPKAVAEMLTAAKDDGALREENGEWLVTNWLVYQPTDDTSAERQRKFREKVNPHNGVINPTEPQDSESNGHNAVMPPDNGVTLSRDTETVTITERVSRDKSLSPSEADGASADSPKKKIPRLPPDWESKWELFFAAYPRRDGSMEKAKGKEKYRNLLASGVDPCLIQGGVDAYRDWALRSQKVGTSLVKQIPTWLNGKCWLEDWGEGDDGFGVTPEEDAR